MAHPVSTAVAAILCAITLVGCRTYPDAVSEFRYPIVRGDVQRGQQAFVKMGCNLCHTVDGVQLPDNAALRPVTINLGGDLTYAKTYGNLVTSIINPDHVISQEWLKQLSPEARTKITRSPMYVNPDMKVTEMIDIVAFLNSRYRLLPGYTEYYY